MSSQLQQTWSDQPRQNVNSRAGSKLQQNPVRLDRSGMSEYNGLGVSKSAIGFAQYRGFDHNEIKNNHQNDPLEMPRIKTPQV